MSGEATVMMMIPMTCGCRRGVRPQATMTTMSDVPDDDDDVRCDGCQVSSVVRSGVREFR